MLHTSCRDYVAMQPLETLYAKPDLSLRLHLFARFRRPHRLRIQGFGILGSWVNTKHPNDTFQVTRNGDEYLIVQGKEVGATFKDGNLEVKGALLSANLTYVKQSDTILTPGFFGQIEYKRKE